MNPYTFIIEKKILITLPDHEHIFETYRYVCIIVSCIL